MMKKAIYVLLAVLTIIGMVSCGGDSSSSSSSGEDPDAINPTSVTLSSVKIGTSAASPPIQGTFSGSLSGITSLTEVNASASQVTDATITLTFATTFGGKARVAKVAADETITEDAFDSVADIAYNATSKTAILTVADGDKLYVRMISQDESATRYYGYEVAVGRDASLKDVTFTTTYGTSNTVSLYVETLGAAFDSIDDADLPANAGDVGRYQFPVKQPAAGFKVKGVGNDVDATVSLSIDGTDFTTITNDSNKIFAEGDALYLEIVSGNGNVTKYYKIVLVLKRVVEIPYGKPATVDASAAADAVWNSATDWLLINRPNPAEGTGLLEMAAADRSHGRAKLLWDEDGIWVYAQVWEKNVSANAGDHTVSSVELFINEGTATTGAVTGSSDQNGGQYRLGANGERTGAPNEAVATFNTLGHFSAAKYATMPTSYVTGTSVTSGYMVIFHAPWRFPNLYPLANDKEITIEIQINATGPLGTRIGVLNWNNENSNSYGSLTDYGDAVLKLNGNTLGPQKPNITTQPGNAAVAINGAAPSLTVAATAQEASGTVLSYQWKSAATAAGPFTNIVGATNATYSVTSTATGGRTYYNVEVTATRGTGGDAKTNAITSNTVAVTIYNPANPTVHTVDLTKVLQASEVNASWDNGGAAVKSVSSSELVWTFGAVTALANNNNAQVGYIKLNDNVIEDILAAKSIIINLTATSAPTTAQFRYCLAANTPSNYNGTGVIGAGEMTSLTGEKTPTWNNPSATTVGHFLLQGRDLTGGEVTVTSITIKILYE
jgi:hypothetical protein